jgi:hypothetical protein
MRQAQSLVIELIFPIENGSGLEAAELFSQICFKVDLFWPSASEGLKVFDDEDT